MLAVEVPCAECAPVLAALKAPSIDECVPLLDADAPWIEGSSVPAVEAPRAEDRAMLTVEVPSTVLVVEAPSTEDPPLESETPRTEAPPVLEVEVPRADGWPAPSVETPRADPGHGIANREAYLASATAEVLTRKPAGVRLRGLCRQAYPRAPPGGPRASRGRCPRRRRHLLRRPVRGWPAPARLQQSTVEPAPERQGEGSWDEPTSSARTTPAGAARRLRSALRVVAFE